MVSWRAGWGLVSATALVFRLGCSGETTAGLASERSTPLRATRNVVYFIHYGFVREAWRRTLGVSCMANVGIPLGSVGCGLEPAESV